MLLRRKTLCTHAPYNSCETCPEGGYACLFHGTLSITVRLTDTEFNIFVISVEMAPFLQTGYAEDEVG